MKIKKMTLIAVFILATTANAATKIWVGTDANNKGAWDVNENWSPATMPVTGDDVYFENSSQDCDVNLAQSATTLNSLNIGQDYTGKIGTTTAYLDIEANTVDIGYSYGPSATLTGSGRIKIDLGDNNSIITIYNSATTATESTKPPVRLLIDANQSILTVKKGKVGLAFDTGETSTTGTITASYVSSRGSDADVYIGPGVTMTTLNQTGGNVTIGCAVTTITSEGGTLFTYGSGAITTLNARGGTITANSKGTITTLTITGGMVDFTKSPAARTVTTIKLDSGGVLKFNPGNLTITNNITSNNAATYTATMP